MLRQETAGYALGKRPPWGSCVMELKNGRGRLHLTAQGLKPYWYEVYVMASGEFQQGVATVRSVYAPEFGGHASGSSVVNVYK